MLEPPPISPDRISAHLSAARGLTVAALDFLPLGADVDTAVYRARCADAGDCFVKLRRGPFCMASVALLRRLADAGVRAIIPPLPDLGGKLVSALDEYAVIVYPFVEGRNAYERPLTDAQRRELGVALAAIHAANIPEAERGDAPTETYGPMWRNMAGELLQLAERRGPFPDEVAADMAAFMRRRARTIRKLIDRASALAQWLVEMPPVVLCHGDLHAGNLHVADNGRIYIVDWDTLIFALSERDLMYVGAQIDRVWPTKAEQAAFYDGYGPTVIYREAIAYYRCERAIEDIAAFGEALLLSGDGGADRAQSLRYFKSAFEPGNAVPTALNSRALSFFNPYAKTS